MERIYTIPLGKSYTYIRTKRTKRAVKLVIEFISRHMKVQKENVKISNRLNNKLWEHGIQKPPRRIKVKAIKEKTIVKVYLPEEEVKKPDKKEKKESKKTEEKKVKKEENEDKKEEKK